MIEKKKQSLRIEDKKIVLFWIFDNMSYIWEDDHGHLRATRLEETLHRMLKGKLTLGEDIKIEFYYINLQIYKLNFMI